MCCFDSASLHDGGATVSCLTQPRPTWPSGRDGRREILDLQVFSRTEDRDAVTWMPGQIFSRVSEMRRRPAGLRLDAAFFVPRRSSIDTGPSPPAQVSRKGVLQPARPPATVCPLILQPQGVGEGGRGWRTTNTESPSSSGGRSCVRFGAVWLQSMYSSTPPAPAAASTPRLPHRRRRTRLTSLELLQTRRTSLHLAIRRGGGGGCMLARRFRRWPPS